MANNVGYLTAKSTKESDCMYTPYYAVDPILKYIPKDKIIWCPFDDDWSAFYQSFKWGGWNVVNSNLKNNQDFFDYEPDKWDIIVSNPPFSMKDRVLKRLNDLNKPFAILLPLNSLQGANRYEFCFKNGIQLLTFDQRIGFHNDNNMNKTIEGSPFASGYFCRGVLPKDLIVESLKKYDQSLI